MEKRFLDLATILQCLRQNGNLYGELPPKRLGRNKAPWKAHLRVIEGRIILCQILDNRGAVVDSGETALEALYAIGQIDWEIVPDEPKITAQLSPLPVLQVTRPSGPLPGASSASTPEVVQSSSPIPYRLVNVSLKQMNQTRWPRDHRLVYILVDGTRPTEKIASMLAMPLASVEQILRDLQTMRIIDLNP